MNNRIENLLPRVVSLEECFNSLPIDEADQRCRFESIRYAVVLRIYVAHFLLASSVSSGGVCGCCLRSRGYLDSLITFKMRTTCSGLSTTSKRRSLTIGFVHNLSPTLFSTLMTTADGATEDDPQSGGQADSESPRLHLGTQNDLSAGLRSEPLVTPAPAPSMTIT